jgi:hypothetical protein
LVNNQYQLLEDEVSASESDSTSGEGTDIDEPPALEEIQPEEIRRDLGAAWIPAGIIELARLQVAGLIDTGVVEHFQPPPQRQRIIVNPRFENPQAENTSCHCTGSTVSTPSTTQTNLHYPLSTEVRVFGDDNTVGTVESDDSKTAMKISHPSMFISQVK